MYGGGGSSGSFSKKDAFGKPTSSSGSILFSKILLFIFIFIFLYFLSLVILDSLSNQEDSAKAFNPKSINFIEQIEKLDSSSISISYQIKNLGKIPGVYNLFYYNVFMSDSISFQVFDTLNINLSDDKKSFSFYLASDSSAKNKNIYCLFDSLPLKKTNVIGYIREQQFFDNLLLRKLYKQQKGIDLQ